MECNIFYLSLYQQTITDMYAIINSDTKQYFSLLGAGMFTSNIEIAQRFNTENDAMFCIEQHIDSNEGFETFGMIFTDIITLN